jgi:signal transduction histidine kinase
LSIAASSAAPAAMIVATGSAIAVARQDRIASIDPLQPLVLVVATIGAAAAIIAAWFVRREHPYVALGLSATVAGLLLPLCAGWTALPDGVRAATLGATPVAVAGVAQIAARWTNGRSALMSAAWLLAGLAVVVHTVGYDPFADPACRRTCNSVQPLAARIVSTRQAIEGASALTLAAGMVGLVAVALNIRGVPRSVVATVLLSVGGLTSTLALSGLIQARFAPSSPSTALLAAVALAAPALVVLRIAIRTEGTRHAVDHLVSRLADPPPTVQFAIPGEPRWVDAAGRAVDDTNGDRLELVDASGPLARLPIQPGSDRVDVMAWLTPAAQLSLRNAQLAAVTKARLRDVQASRRRIVEASDAERQRIERDLHDGAQQRLVSAAFHLTLARRRLPEHDADVADAEANVRMALRNLRDLAHGIFPAVLASEGLRAGVEDLVVNVNLPTTLDMPDQLTISIESAMAAHATVSAALDAAQSAGATRATVAIDRIDGTLDVRIESDAPAPHRHHLLHVFDRVGAVGGELSIDPTATGSIVRAEIPCAS